MIDEEDNPLRNHKDDCSIVSKFKRVVIINCKCGHRPPMEQLPRMHNRVMGNMMCGILVKKDLLRLKEQENIHEKSVE